MASLQGKSVVITGASSGIGEATARRLCDEGANLTLIARRHDRLEAMAKALGDRILWKVADVTKAADVTEAIRATLQRFGRVDALVNNAGVMPLSKISEGRVSDWDQTIDTNVKGVLYCINAVLEPMIRQGSGHIINVCSTVAQRVLTPEGAIYSGTKAAVRMISDGLRMELAGKVRVTVVHPGFVDTELRNGIPDPTRREQFNRAAPKALRPEDLADAIAYVLSVPAHVAINEIVVSPAGFP